MKGKRITPDEHDLFEAAGARLHGWAERDYERNYELGVAGDYAFLEQRRAFAIWLEARKAPKCA